ncbi:glycosyl hydrolase family 18 protein [Cryobacterium sp. CG_9.6]|uniref:glycosyl hydrolase family 18 protein n=1 Tax=Cryobacterium sp. CG_9.6 TaxID=2760710 RepID=UPI0024762CBE|nr:glycosyl hydrolase family 18 protein [Cryobacterium sp. CG_9.6]MDH6235571.1 chitinase [Cryobacterium sp. CG_9.6]
MSQRFPGRRLSGVRVGAVFVIAGLVTTGAYFGVNQLQDVQAASTGDSFFAGYVDVTAQPEFAFTPSSTGTGQSAMLSFIVADSTDLCSPSWGTFFGPGESGAGRDLDRRIAQYAQNGGEVAISFGGQANKELATVCTSASQLRKAYRSVVDHYDLETIDLDIEGRNLSDAQAGQRRAQAIAAVQAERASAGTPLAVWLTLPVSPTGLTEEGLVVVRQMLDAQVDLAGVNVMTMNYGGSRDASTTMFEASAAAAEATHAQLGTVYRVSGQDLGNRAVWSKIGLTPMIGQNDEAGEVFTMRDATLLNAFAQEMGVGRMSLWSLNRDHTCSANYPDVTRVSDVCSGVDQGSAVFADVLGQGFANRVEAITSTPGPPAVEVVDNPATSPYPIWSEGNSYVTGERIVWRGHVYSARWYTEAVQPDDPLIAAVEAPWKLIGPVLPGDRPAPVLVVPTGTYPAWAADMTYLKQDRVMLDGRVFEAKWWSLGDSPQTRLDGGSNSPWDLLNDSEMEKLLSQ